MKQPPTQPVPPRLADSDDTHRRRRIVGIILILVGLLFYAQYFVPSISWATLWPGILIVLGTPSCSPPTWVG